MTGVTENLVAREATSCIGPGERERVRINHCKQALKGIEDFHIQSSDYDAKMCIQYY